MAATFKRPYGRSLACGTRRVGASVPLETVAAQWRERPRFYVSTGDRWRNAR
jgi:hypothetical protein